MPLVSGDDLKPQKLYLPTSAELPEEQKEWVVLEQGPIMGADIIALDNLNTVLEFKYDIMVKRLLEWNVLDTDGEVAKINGDNVKRLPLQDLTYLLGVVDTEVKPLPKEQPSS